VHRGKTRHLEGKNWRFDAAFAITESGLEALTSPFIKGALWEGGALHGWKNRRRPIAGDGENAGA
jgi:hypothetical protein